MKADAAGVPGLPCPQCGQRIVMRMETLLALRPIVCGCGLALRVDAQRSKDTLDELRELQRRLEPLRDGPWTA